MNYGTRGRELLLDLKRSDWLPAYNEEGVRSTLQEIYSHTEELTVLVRASSSSNTNNNNRTSTTTPTNDEDGGGGSGSAVISGVGGAGAGPAIENRPSLILHDASIRRNKRCLLAYHAYRMDKLRILRWETGGNLPPSLKHLLSESEIDFFHEYDKLISKFQLLSGQMSNLDLNADQFPPEENLIQVRVVQSGLGSIETEMCGTVQLELGSMHYLPRGDVEHLIRGGSVVQLSGEESF